MSEFAWAPMPDGSERLITFRPAFHRCDPDPRKDFGIGSVHMWFVLRHDGWAISWELSTNWGLPDEAFALVAPTCKHPMHQHGYPAGLGPHAGPVRWHSPVEFYGCFGAHDGCEWIGGACYGDVGYLLGDEVFDTLRIEGDEALWSMLADLLTSRRNETVPA